MNADLLKRVGNPEQLISVRESVLSDGKGKGSRIITVNNGLFSFTLLLDRGFDVADMRYKGVNLSFISKNGIVSPALAHTDAVGFTSSFSGGFLYTCGLDNVGGPIDGKVLHGSQTMVPASCVKVEKFWEGDEYVAKISATLENTALFGPNLVIDRTYIVRYNSSKVEIKDTLTNKGFLDSEYMMLYHFNFGYPLLDDGAEVIIDSISCTPRNEDSAKREGEKYLITPPEDDATEFVYFHELKGQRATASIKNEKLGLVAQLSFNRDNLDSFCQWKSIVSGDYALGLEPCTTTIDAKKPKILKSGESAVNEIIFTVKDYD